MQPARLPQRFQFVRELGRGGMGAVYEAIDNERGGRVAIKTLPSDDPVAISRFKREFRSLQDIHHPNLVALGELFCEAGEWAFSMDLVEGMDLLEWVRAPRDGGQPSPVSDGPTGTIAGMGQGGVLEKTEPAPLANSILGGAEESIRPAAGVDLLPGGRVSVRAPRRELSARDLFDEMRLRDAFTQLTRGLDALHAANKVHRDVKPGNVRVRLDGQVFLLDFGLVAELAAHDHLTRDHGAMGTPAFMAPEQAAGAEATPAADFYAVGVALFAALTDDLPFHGAPLHVLMAKQSEVAPRVRNLVQDVPADLDELCARLLEFDPKRRPSADEIVRMLDADRKSVAKVRTTETHGSSVSPFVGRKDEFSALHRAFSAVENGRSAAVVLEGESGTGKSFLAKRFLDHLRSDHPDLTVVAGRCYEHEAVPYNAWDAAIESLASRWMNMDVADAASLVPLHIAPLVQTFPSLRLVPQVTRALSQIASRVDPREIRSRAFAALREVFTRLTNRGPLVVFIDDIQWADHDSTSLLAEVLREPDAPPLLFLATARPLAEHPDVERELAAALPRTAHRCSVSQLPHDDAVTLARHLLARTKVSEEEAESIAREAHGHALFIAELVLHVAATGRAARGTLSLEEVLWGRVSGLSAPERAIVSVLSLGARPLPEAVVLRAADVPASHAPRLLQGLRVAHLTRSTRVDGIDRLETYHDRVRKAVFDRTDAEARARIFERLATACEQHLRNDTHLLTEYWKGAGDLERAGMYARDAGDAACDALAFDRAANFYETALARPSCSDGERHELTILLAETLSKAGRARAAAESFRRALEGAKDDVEALALEQKIGDQLLRAGDYEAGIETTKRVLARIRIPWPASPTAVVATLLLYRLYFLFRGRRFTQRSESAVTVADLARIDVCWNIGGWLLMVDSTRAVVFQLHHLRLSLRTGALSRVAAAAAAEITRTAAMKGGRTAKEQRSLAEQIARASALAEAVKQPFETAFFETCAGMGLVAACKPREGAAYLARGEKMFREECRGQGYYVTTIQLWAIRGWFYLGEWRALAEKQSSAYREACDARDRYGMVQFRLGFANFGWLIRDDPDTARFALEEALVECEGRGFSVEHHYGLLARANIGLYRGDVGEALAVVEERWPLLRRSFLRLFAGVRLQSSDYRARLHLGNVRGEAAPASRSSAVARRWTRDVAGCGSAYAPSMATLLRAQISFLEGDEAAAVVGLRRALSELPAIDLGAHAAAARRALGKLVKGDEGVALVREGDAFLEGETVKNIPAVCRCLLPGFAQLD